MKAVIGNWEHEGIQKNIVKLLEGVEVEKKVKFKAGPIFCTGHVDIYHPDGHKARSDYMISDIKTVGTYVFPGITGKRGITPRTYTEAKRESSISQGNCYAINVKASHYTILWLDRADGLIKIELFQVDPEAFQEILKKLEEVDMCVKMARTMGKIKKLPEFKGVCMCDMSKKKTSYCRHHVNGTMDSEGHFFKKSPANCPGYDRIMEIKDTMWKHEILDRFMDMKIATSDLPPLEEIIDKYTKPVNGEWYCSICNLPFSQILNPGEGIFTAQHLWYRHGIRFDPQGIKGRPLEGD